MRRRGDESLQSAKRLSAERSEHNAENRGVLKRDRVSSRTGTRSASMATCFALSALRFPLSRFALSAFCTHLLALSGYLLLSIALTWPLTRYWGTAYVGNFEEATRNSWNMWWVRHALAHGQNPFWTDMLYFPDGMQLYVQPINISNTFLTLPVYELFGLAAAHNTAVLLAVALTGYGGFLLVRAFVPGVAIPFLCGALLTSGPFHMVQFEFNHLNLLTIQWLPLYFLALYGLERGGGATRRFKAQSAKRKAQNRGLLGRDVFWSKKGMRKASKGDLFCTSRSDRFPLKWVTCFALLAPTAFRLKGAFALQHKPHAACLVFRRILVPTLLAIAMFMLVTLTDWYWALFCGIATAVWCGLSLVCTRERGPLFRRYLLFGGGVLLCLSPLLIGIIRFREQVPTVDMSASVMWQGYIRGFSGDTLGIFFPAIYHPLWGNAAREWLQQTAPNYSPSGWYIAAGWVLLTCAAVGVWYDGRARWQLLVVAGVMWVLSLGPSLRVAGVDTGIPLPYVWLQNIEMLSTARKPSHFAIVSIVLLTIFAGLGLQRLAQGVAPRYRSGFLLGIAALAAFELWPALPLEPQVFERHPVFAQIRERPGVVADLPLEWRESGRALRNQFVHEQPLVAGYVSRRPDYPILRYQPLLHQIGHMRSWPTSDIMPVSLETLRAMQCHTPVRHVVLRKDAKITGSVEALQATLTMLNNGPLVPSYEDAVYVWYELPLFEDQCQPFVYLGPGWYDVEQNDEMIWRRASAANDLWLVNPFDEPIIAHMTMTAEGFETARAVEVWQDDRQIAAWEVARARRPYQWLIHLPPGTHRLQVRAATGWDAVTEREVSIAVMDLRIQDYTVLKAEN